MTAAPHGAVRITITPDQVDHYGQPTPEAVRWLRAKLWDLPEGAVVRVDLGAVRESSLIIEAIATLPCAHEAHVEIEHSDWRLVTSATLDLRSRLDATRAYR